MDKVKLLAYLENIDQALLSSVVLYIYGSAACILLDQPGRSSLDIDVAAPYSNANESDLRRAAEEAGIPVNPAADYDDNHIEWIGALRLCLPPPQDEYSITLWQGKKLVIKTGSVADLVASKLIRYDELDQGDIQYLLQSNPVTFENIVAAVKRLPPTFANDPVLQDNLASLYTDMQTWSRNYA